MDAETTADQAAILAALHAVRERIDATAHACGRRPEDVRLLLATKTVPPERILVALRDGSTLIGENRAQELTEKADALSVVPHEAHFIGHLQKNKINQVLRYASCVQSIDSVTLADQVATRIAADRAPLEVFVQVNTSAEDSKYGCAPADALPLARHVGSLPQLRLRGFMTIGLFSDDAVAVRASYRRLREVRDEVLAASLPGSENARELSMGMSGDLDLAIEEGATMVRVGTAVFGVRPTSDTYYWPPSG